MYYHTCPNTHTWTRPENGILTGHEGVYWNYGGIFVTIGDSVTTNIHFSSKHYDYHYTVVDDEHPWGDNYAVGYSWINNTSYGIFTVEPTVMAPGWKKLGSQHYHVERINIPGLLIRIFGGDVSGWGYTGYGSYCSTSTSIAGATTEISSQTIMKDFGMVPLI